MENFFVQKETPFVSTDFMALSYIPELIKTWPQLYIQIRSITTILKSSIFSNEFIVGMEENDKGQMCLSDSYIDENTDLEIKYEIIKKLTRHENVYEIRLHIENGIINPRILFTPNRTNKYYAWSYGFTKEKDKCDYTHGDANATTDFIANITDIIYNDINKNKETEWMGSEKIEIEFD